MAGGALSEKRGTFPFLFLFFLHQFCLFCTFTVYNITIFAFSKPLVIAE